jgi:hypothetical protein
VIEVIVSTEIAAPAATVWRILVELDQFAAWNPFIRVARGELRPGGTVHVRVQTGVGIPMRFSAKVLDFSEGRELHWRGQVISRFLACGEHWFELVPLGPDRVRFRQRERFSGIVPRLGKKLLEREARHGFELMNNALRIRAETEHRVGRIEKAAS